jgi:hypothetical protein
MASKNELLVCPLMSVSANTDMMCVQERCAWFIPGTRKCSVYVMGYNAVLEVGAKQTKQH